LRLAGIEMPIDDAVTLALTLDKRVP